MFDLKPPKNFKLYNPIIPNGITESLVQTKQFDNTPMTEHSVFRESRISKYLFHDTTTNSLSSKIYYVICIHPPTSFATK